jgi:hypothetical protein
LKYEECIQSMARQYTSEISEYKGYPYQKIYKRGCVALRSLRKQNWRKSQSTSSGNPAQSWFCKGYLFCLCCFLLFSRIDALRIQKRKYIQTSCFMCRLDLILTLLEIAKYPKLFWEIYFGTWPPWNNIARVAVMFWHATWK